MSSESKIFDSIRIKSRRREPNKQPDVPTCEWEGCDKPGIHKAPKPNRAEGMQHFCLQHVREYNQKYNFFEGVDDDEAGDAMRRAARTGERPTWGMGSNAHGRGNPKPRQGKATGGMSSNRVHDPLNIFKRAARQQGRTRPMTPKELKLLEADKRALETLGLEGRPTTDEIKQAYKALVKKHHPDANGGDRGSEDRLRAIIAAYNHLKQKGFI